MALNVVAGSSTWNSATFPQTDPEELVGMCGGFLLEVDEETGCVHFIHHSAALHLLSEGLNRPTMQYHFTAQEAELAAAGTCVTYLNFDEFERRMTFRARNDLVINNLTDSVNRSLMSASLLSRIVLHIRPQPRQMNTVGTDISRILRSMMPAKSERGVRRYFEYAKTYCIFHTKHFHAERTPKPLYSLWLRLLNNNSAKMHLPWQSNPADQPLTWALRTGHGGVLWGLLDTSVESDLIHELCQSLEKSTAEFSLEPEQLGNLLARYIHYASLSDINPATVANFLLRKGADPREKFRGLTSLEHAVAFARARKNKYLFVHMLKQFVQGGCNPNSTRMDTNVLLFFIEFGSPLDVELLLLYGANANINVDGRSPLGAAVYVGNESTTRVLLSAGARISSMFDGRSSLRIAVEQGFVSIAQQLVSHGADLNFRTETGSSSYAMAIRRGHAPMASYIRSKIHPLLATRPRPTSASLYLLFKWRHACGRNTDDCRDVDTDKNWDDDSDYIVTENDFMIWQNLTRDQSAIDVIQQQERDTVHSNLSRLLAKGQDVNQKCSSGFSALDHAVLRGDFGSVSILLAYGANVNHKIPGGHTPLTLAIFRCDANLVDILLLHGADTELHGPLEQSALELSQDLLVRKDVDKGDANRIVQLLLSRARHDVLGSRWTSYIVNAIQEGFLTEKTLVCFLSRGGTVTQSFHNDIDPRYNIFVLSAERGWIKSIRFMQDRYDLLDSVSLALYEMIFRHDCRITCPEDMACHHGLPVLFLLLEWMPDFLRAGNMGMQAISEALTHGRDTIAQYLIIQCRDDPEFEFQKDTYASILRSLKQLAIDNGCIRSSEILASMEYELKVEVLVPDLADLVANQPGSTDDKASATGSEDLEDCSAEQSETDGLYEAAQQKPITDAGTRPGNRPNLRHLYRHDDKEYLSFGDLRAEPICGRIQSS